MDKELENKIIELYVGGVGSTTISKNIKVPEHTILKLLREKSLIRNRKHSEEFYSNFWMENNMWCGFWTCNTCNKKIKFCVNKKCLLNRNLKKKKTCKPCSLYKQVGKGNPFYGKKHTQDTKEKILLSLKERINGGKFIGYNRSKAEDELIKTLTENNINCTPNFLLNGKIFDIYIPEYNLLIEYNGDYWHCNPKKYDSTYFNEKKSKTAKELWEYDTNKLHLATKHGYTCEVIWESDYKKDKNIILNILKKYDNKFKN